MLTCDIIFLVMIVYIGVREAWDVVTVIYRNGPIDGLRSYLDIWNVIDWINIGLSIVLVGQYHACVLRGYDVNVSVAASNQGAYQHFKMMDVFYAFEACAFAYEQLKVFVVLFAFSSILSFFKAFL